MPRRYYYRRTVRPKQKWAINTASASVASTSQLTLSANQAATIGTIVCENSTRINNSGGSSSSSAQILKTGRWKFKGYISTPSNAVGYLVYLVYVPQGYYLNSGDGDDLLNHDADDIFYRHPEWVLAWSRKDYAVVDQINEISLTSRLKRNLNTGDQIQIRAIIFNTSTTSFTVGSGVPIIRGTVSYCCRAN